MSARRDQIRMTPQEIERYLEQRKTIILCSNGLGGFPHPVPMWFRQAPDGAIEMTTYSKSQKAMNIRRDPRVTLLAESGVEYAELKSVQIFGRAELIEDRERITDVLIAASGRSAATPRQELPALRAAMASTASKRVLIRVTGDKVLSWDHTKLEGAY